MRKLQIILLNLLLTVSLAGNASDKLKIAIVGPLSGNYSGYGKQMLIGASFAANNISHTNIELIPFDDQNIPAKSLEIAKNIAKDKSIQIVVGHGSSETTKNVVDIYGKHGKLVFVPIAGAPIITQKNIFTLFRICGKDDQQAIKIASFINDSLSSKNIAILHDQSDHSRLLADLVINELVEKNRPPVLYQGINKKKNNFDSLFVKLKELNVDVIYFPSLYPEVGALAQAMHKNKLQLPLITTDSIALPEFLSTTQQQASTSVLMSFGPMANQYPLGKKVLQQMQNENIAPSPYAMYTYSAIQAITQAQHATKSQNATNLAYWLHHNKINSVIGELSWNTNGDVMHPGFKIYLWKDGKYTLIN